MKQTTRYYRLQKQVAIYRLALRTYREIGLSKQFYKDAVERLRIERLECAK